MLNSPLRRGKTVEETLGMSFMLLVTLVGLVIVIAAIVITVLVIAFSSGGRDRDRDERN